MRAALQQQQVQGVVRRQRAVLLQRRPHWRALERRRAALVGAVQVRVVRGDHLLPHKVRQLRGMRHERVAQPGEQVPVLSAFPAIVPVQDVTQGC